MTLAEHLNRECPDGQYAHEEIPFHVLYNDAVNRWQIYGTNGCLYWEHERFDGVMSYFNVIGFRAPFRFKTSRGTPESIGLGAPCEAEHATE